MALVEGVASGAAEVPPLLELNDVSLSYGAVRALAGVSLAVAAGQVMALCGDNGAGKSSLIKIVAGVQRPDGGALAFAGAPLALDGPRAALARGIAAIYQDLALAPRLAIWQNIFMGAELRRATPIPGLKRLDKTAMRARSRVLLERLRVDLPDMGAPVESLSGGQRQAVAISRALLWEARLIIMDEPTAALGVKETASVLDLIRELRRVGVAVLLVSHSVDDVLAVSDAVTVLRHGRVAARATTASLDGDALKHLIIGTSQAA